MSLYFLHVIGAALALGALTTPGPIEPLVEDPSHAVVLTVPAPEIPPADDPTALAVEGEDGAQAVEPSPEPETSTPSPDVDVTADEDPELLAPEPLAEPTECALTEEGLPQSPHGCDFDQSICNDDNCVGLPWPPPEPTQQPSLEDLNPDPLPEPSSSAAPTQNEEPKKSVHILDPSTTSQPSSPSTSSTQGTTSELANTGLEGVATVMALSILLVAGGAGLAGAGRAAKGKA
ncbi:hypothetical protein [Timonella senegalensis]|uniref:hypothetical protein n=1 Tax=Timonella senegalensis TaxID=1465825 RepID=UPI002FDE4BDC